ncbi:MULTISPECIES: ester cyclase [unclassified Streptomyces]|uniref:ester cyclase n=1 Tax=unclassified Streptomyces TaxID=2593676 RepID=UPI0022576024|nr:MULTISPECIES: ester cyclase [unclassified Streptomyces]MCX5050476.1 ester cyclase [Streptomyces sp. NBC_00474]MCX5060853.1 ester cyclase [Streptomyces sp. NBC_00452]MCX5248385.1 ester cyclase [Streptomyces sp. NBC_00201]MCX5293522.1 ester cyclase [Streptomyces sp. NBC_00183]
MTFVQIIDCRTSRFDDMNRLMDTWVEQTRGKRTATHSVIGKDRADGSHFIEIVEFPSYEEAMQNSSLPETDKIFREMVALCDEMPTFTDLDVVRDEQLNADTSRRFFETLAAGGELAPLDDLIAENYHDHDPSNEQDTIGMDAMRREIGMWRSAFEFSFAIEDQITQGDRVCTRWTFNGTQKGEFMGLPSQGKKARMTGTTIHRFGEHEKIVEGWWQYDRLGLMAQLGALEGLEQ